MNPDWHRRRPMDSVPEEKNDLMAIRLRTVGGVRVALCAAETDPEPGDVYLDDADHYALSAKFAQDWETGTEYPREWPVMESQRKRNAREALEEWSRKICGESATRTERVKG